MPKITGLVALRGVKGRVRVYIDGEHAVTVAQKNAARMGLRVGQDADREAVMQVVGEDEKTRAQRSALYYLGRAERSRAQVVRYLEAREYAPEIVNSVMDKVDAYGYVDDARYARMLVEDRARLRGKSRRAVRQEMREKGLDAATIEEAMALYGDREEMENAVRIARKYYQRNRGDREGFERKAGAALYRRGYDWEVIRDALRAVEEGGEDD
ncbi:MAG: regulatory protein RecX [Clostridiales bacterium]|nr:regulatory protein RecX [Clostridiales bacterium]